MFENFRYSYPQFKHNKNIYKHNFMSYDDIKNLQFFTKCNVYKDYNKGNVFEKSCNNLQCLKNENFDGDKKTLELISAILNKIDHDYNRNVETIGECLNQKYNTYTLIVNNILNSYAFLFFVNPLEIGLPIRQSNHEKCQCKIVFVYYLHKDKFLVYGRYYYIDDVNIEIDKKGCEFLETFKTNFQYLLNLNFLQFSNSLPSSRHLDYVKYPIWYNYHTDVFNTQDFHKKMTDELLRNFIAFIEEKYGKSSEITFFHASLNRRGQYIDLCYDMRIFLILEMRGVISKNEITKLNILALDIFIIAIRNNQIKNQICYIMFPLHDYESMYQINYLFGYWYIFQLSIKRCNQIINGIDTTKYVKAVIYNCIFKQIFLGFIRYDLQKYKDYILCRRRLYFFLILNNARYDFFLTGGNNLDPTYLNWLRKLKNYKCILQSKKFTIFIEKHRNYDAFKLLETHCYAILEKFCNAYPFFREKNNRVNNHMKIFYFFQKPHEITPDDLSGIISREIQVFFKN